MLKYRRYYVLRGNNNEPIIADGRKDLVPGDTLVRFLDTRKELNIARKEILELHNQ